MPKLSRSGFHLALLVAAFALLSLPALADSQARIVRLSDVQGTVQIDKNTGLGFEHAFLNLPITQGTQLKTSDGRAEIEFEDGSTMRIAPNSTLEFSTLGLTDDGKRISTINLAEGMAYVNWLGKNTDQFAVTFSREKVSVEHAVHFRINASARSADLAVFKGEVSVEGPSGNLTVAKNKTATFDAANDDRSTLADHIDAAPLDSWDKEAAAYHDQYAKNNSSPYGYGASDLSYYGSYTNVPGYGTLWQPYFTGIGWDPFMDGAWSWYPGYGFMFASAYPWGWLPYRYGNWQFVPGFGWMWQPGAFGTWLTVPHYTNTTLVHVNPLVAPAGGVRAVVVGKGGAVTTSSTSLMVHTGSAGLGIPRGSVSNLKHLNTQVARNGSAEVHASQFSASSGHWSGLSSGGHSTASAPPSFHGSIGGGHSSHR